MKKKLLACLMTILLVVMLIPALSGCENIGAKSFKGEEVTKEQWDFAFKKLNEITDKKEAKFTVEGKTVVTVNMKLDFIFQTGMKAKRSGKVSTTISLAAKKDGNGNGYMKGSNKCHLSGKAEFICEYCNFSDFHPTETDETEETYTQYPDNSVATAFVSAISAYIPETDYSFYKYSKSDKGYVLKKEDNNADVKKHYVLKFDQRSRLRAIYFKGQERIYKVVQGENPYEYTDITNTTTEIKIDYSCDEIEMPEESKE